MDGNDVPVPEMEGSPASRFSIKTASLAAAWLTKEKSSQASCKSLPFTLIFYMSFLATQLLHREVGTTFPLASSLGSTMLKGTVPSPLSVMAPEPHNATSTSKRFTKLSDVKSWGDALMYMEVTVVPFIWANGTGGPGALMGVNQLIGGVRLQQWRLSAVECAGAEGLRDAYNNFMVSMYNRTCRSLDSEYETNDIAGSRPTDSASLQGARTDSDTGTYIYWIPARQTTEEALGHIQGLRKNRWLSAATEKIKMQYAMYCGRIGYFFNVEVDISMDPTGSFSVSVKPRSLPTQVWGKMSTVLADLWFSINLFYLFCGEAFGVLNALRRRRLRRYVFQFYRLINLSLIGVGSGVVIFFMYLSVRLGGITDELTSILEVDTAGLTDAATAEHLSRLDDSYNMLSSLGTLVRWNELVSFWYSLMMLLKFFQNFQANERLAIITKTLNAASEELLHFMLIFLLVFFNFIIGAHFLFGKAIKEWSSIVQAINTGFRALMGDFDFDSMYRVAPMTATVWFFTYMLLIFLLMINMLLAIVMDAYASVKEEAGQSESLLLMIKRQAIITLEKLGARKRALEARRSIDSGVEDLVEDMPPPAPKKEDPVEAIQAKLAVLEASVSELVKLSTLSGDAVRVSPMSPKATQPRVPAGALEGPETPRSPKAQAKGWVPLVPAIPNAEEAALRNALRDALREQSP